MNVVSLCLFVISDRARARALPVPVPSRPVALSRVEIGRFATHHSSSRSRVDTLRASHTMDAARVEELRAALAGSVSPDGDLRARADAYLKSAASLPGAALGLLALASDANGEMGTRQSASIYFKHLVKRSWARREGLDVDPTRGNHATLDEGEKAAVRRVALEAVASTPNKVRSQLMEAIRVMVHHDFPLRWPEVATQVLSNLNEASASESGRLCGTVLVLHALCRKYEFKDANERADVEEIIRVVFPKLLEILQALLAYQGPPNAELEELKKAICKTYWSATYLDVGPSLAEEGTFQAWMLAFHAVITSAIPTEGMPTGDKTEIKHWPWWKTKKWALHVVNRVFNRYGNPKSCKPEHKDLAVTYSTKYASVFLGVYIELLGSMSSGEVMPDRIVNLSIQHVTTALGVPSTYKVLQPHLDDIFQRVVFPVLCFNAEDDELWVDDPHEYVRKTQDFIEDMYSPRMAATGYLHELCKTGKRMKENLPKVLAAVVQILNKHAASAHGAAMDARGRYELDGALHVVTSLSAILTHHPEYANQMESMLMAHVFPVFGCAHGHVRAKAVACAAKYSGITFTEQNNFLQLLSKVVDAMRDPDLPVRVEAVVALGAFIHAAEDVSALKSILPQLLDDFFKLMNEVESEDVVYTLETITERFGEDIAPFALGMTQNLAAAFWKVVQESESKEDDDCGILASIGCLRAMSTILESVSSLPHMYPELEAAVFPILQKMIGEQGFDVFEEVLEILSYLTYFTPEVTPRMWELWPLMIATMDEWALQYFENLLIPLDNFISRGTERFLAPGTPYVEDTYNVCKKVLEGDYPEPDCVPAPKLMECVMTNCRGRVDVVVGPFVELALRRIGTAELPYLRDLLMLTFAHALHYDPAIALATTNRLGETNRTLTLWSTMLATKTKSGERKCFASEHAKKVCALGLMGVLRAPDDTLTPEIHGSMNVIMDSLVSLLGDLRAQIARRKEDEASGKRRFPWDVSDDDDDEYDVSKYDDDDEGDDDVQFDATTLEALAKKARDADPYAFARGGGAFGGGFDDDDDDDGFWFDDDDDETYTSPLDDVDAFIAFSECMNALQGSPRANAVSPTSVDLAQSLMQYAAQRAVDFPKERAEAKAKQNQSS